MFSIVTEITLASFSRLDKLPVLCVVSVCTRFDYRQRIFGGAQSTGWIKLITRHFGDL